MPAKVVVCSMYHGLVASDGIQRVGAFFFTWTVLARPAYLRRHAALELLSERSLDKKFPAVEFPSSLGGNNFHFDTNNATTV